MLIDDWTHEISTHKLYNKNSNDSNHASSRVPYFCSPSEPKKRRLKLRLNFWKFHLKEANKHAQLLHNHQQHQQQTKTATRNGNDRRSKRRSFTPAGGLTACTTRETLLDRFKERFWSKKSWFFGELIDGVVAGMSDGSKVVDEVAMAMVDKHNRCLFLWLI